MFRRKEYEILNEMLDAAIDGTFEETCFDESELSKLQSKLMRYLSSSSMSERKMREEKENIKGLITNIFSSGENASYQYSYVYGIVKGICVRKQRRGICG